MKTVLITGILGFIGRNLKQALSRRPDIEILGFDIDNDAYDLKDHIRRSNAIFHLAGVNRPEQEEEFEQGNTDLTRRICELLEKSEKHPLLVFSSSTQAEIDNPYGRSKRKAEDAIIELAKRSHVSVRIYRLPGVFGKLCRPNYNSVVATLCYNVARGLPISISEPAKKIELVYIDDVISAFLYCLDRAPHGYEYRDVSPSFVITLGDLARQIEMFRDSRHSLLLPDFSDPFLKRLYAKYISYFEENDFAYQLTIREDARGELAEFLKQAHFGQIFISRTKPGITRGNHFHHTKVEKFLVVDGDAVIRFRRIDGTDIIEYRVSGKDFKVVDIPPGYTHSIENVGPGELITLFWADEVFDPKDSDTYPLDVVKGDKKGANS